MHLNNKQVNLSSLEIDGVSTRDYPDFCDAYFSHACYKDGVALSDSELDALTDSYAHVIHAMALDVCIDLAGA